MVYVNNTIHYMEYSMAEIKFKQYEQHTVFVKKTMIVSTENFDGEELVTEEQLKQYIAEDSTGDDDIDDKCHDLMLDAECIEESDIDWWSDRKGCTEYEYEVIE